MYVYICILEQKAGPHIHSVEHPANLVCEQPDNILLAMEWCGAELQRPCAPGCACKEDLPGFLRKGDLPCARKVTTLSFFDIDHPLH